MTKLSVNINKIATIRNARGGDIPSVIDAAINCQRFGADGITVHPRPDQRHITYEDVFQIQEVINTEFNIEGYPSDEFIEMVLKIIPTQVTLVPDGPNIITSNSGWNTIKSYNLLKDVIKEFKSKKIRTSIFVNPEIKMIEGAKLCNADRIELYTEDYAKLYQKDKKNAIKPFIEAANKANEIDIGVNAGHDLNLNNLSDFVSIGKIKEVSIGHALISDALEFGLAKTTRKYLDAISKGT